MESLRSFSFHSPSPRQLKCHPFFFFLFCPKTCASLFLQLQASSSRLLFFFWRFCRFHQWRQQFFQQFLHFEGPETVQDFALMHAHDIIRSRRNKIFLLMEEVRRLRIQQRLKQMKAVHEESSEYESETPEIPLSIPFLPHLTPETLNQLYLKCFSFVSGIILFGGLIAPILELKLVIGGTSYEDFIRSLHLPLQLSQVDPIVASFSGGAVGVISALMLIEVNNVEQQEKKRCKYCNGSVKHFILLNFPKAKCLIFYNYCNEPKRLTVRVKVFNGKKEMGLTDFKEDSDERE